MKIEFQYIQPLELSQEVIDKCSHPGSCDEDVAECAEWTEIKAQLQKIEPDALRLELWDRGAWTTEELQDHKANLRRILWIAAGDAAEMEEM